MRKPDGGVAARSDRLWHPEMERVWRPFLAASGGQKWPPLAVRNGRSWMAGLQKSVVRKWPQLGAAMKENNTYW